MSRAFVSERDGSFCTEKMLDCVWADENGKCPFPAVSGKRSWSQTRTR
jgi:hypothetical protein